MRARVCLKLTTGAGDEIEIFSRSHIKKYRVQFFSGRCFSGGVSSVWDWAALTCVDKLIQGRKIARVLCSIFWVLCYGCRERVLKI